MRGGVDADDRMCHVRDADTHPRVRADTPVLILRISYFVLTSVLSRRTRSFQCVIKVGILYMHNDVTTRGVTSRDIYLCLTETVCVLNFMTSNECRRRGYRQTPGHLLAAQWRPGPHWQSAIHSAFLKYYDYFGARIV